MVVMQRALDRSVRWLLQRLLIGLGLLTLLICLSSAFISWRQQASLRTIFDDRVVPLHDLQRVHQWLNVELPSVLQATVRDDAALTAVHQRVQSTWRKYLVTYLTPEEAQLVKIAQLRLDALLNELSSAALTRERYMPALHAFNSALGPLLDLQVRVAEAELQAARADSQRGLVLALGVLVLCWALIIWAHDLIRRHVVWPLRVVADALASLAAPRPVLGPEAKALSGDFAEVGEQLRRLQVGLDERMELQARTEALLQQLRSAQQELVESEKLASLGSLVAGVAHELNTPLGVAVAVNSSMTERAQTLRRELEAGQLRRSGVDALLAALEQGGALMQRNLERAAALIGSFKQVAVDRSGMQRRSFDLSQTVNEILDSLRPVYGRGGAVFVNELPAGIRMEGYPGTLGQVLTNLVVNAVLHGFEGGPGQLRIALLDRDAESLRLLVQDDGRGMSPEVAARAFEPFFTTRLGQGGSGLGLAIVRNLVLGVLGGRIQLQTEAGQGCRFVIHLPLLAPLRDPS